MTLTPLLPLFLDTQALWPRLPNLKWMHSASAGLEHLLFPELVQGPVTLTNAKVIRAWWGQVRGKAWGLEHMLFTEVVGAGSLVPLPMQKWSGLGGDKERGLKREGRRQGVPIFPYPWCKAYLLHKAETWNRKSDKVCERDGRGA